MSALDDFIVDMHYLTPIDRIVFQKVVRYRNSDIGRTLQPQPIMAESLGVSSRALWASLKKLKKLGFIDEWKVNRGCSYVFGSWFEMEWDMAVRKAGTRPKFFHEMCERKVVQLCKICESDSQDLRTYTSSYTSVFKEREENSKDKEEKEMLVGSAS